MYLFGHFLRNGCQATTIPLCVFIFGSFAIIEKVFGSVTNKLKKEQLAKWADAKLAAFMLGQLSTMSVSILV
jgi:hypothetical protein